MFQDIIKTFLRMAPMATLLILAFGQPFFMLLSVVEVQVIHKMITPKKQVCVCMQGCRNGGAQGPGPPLIFQWVVYISWSGCMDTLAALIIMRLNAHSGLRNFNISLTVN